MTKTHSVFMTQKKPIKWKTHSVFHRNIHAILALLLLSFVSSVRAAPIEVVGKWYESVDAGWTYNGQSHLPGDLFKSIPAVSLTGGEFWFQGDFAVEAPGRYVLDFKNTSIIGHFRHFDFQRINSHQRQIDAFGKPLHQRFQGQSFLRFIMNPVAISYNF